MASPLWPLVFKREGAKYLCGETFEYRHVLKSKPQSLCNAGSQFVKVHVYRRD